MNITIYTKDNCSYCEKIKKFFAIRESRHVESSDTHDIITVYRLGEDFTREEFKSEFGESATFPQVIANGYKLGGCKETIQKFMSNSVPTVPPS